MIMKIIVLLMNITFDIPFDASSGTYAGDDERCVLGSWTNGIDSS